MPTYEYACRDCGNHMEVVQSFRDAPLTTCSNCNGALRKVFSAAGIIFKGSGYYVTDTRKKAEDSSSAETTGGKDAPQKGGSSSSDKSDKGDKGDAAASA